MNSFQVAIVGAGNIAGGYDRQRRAGATGIFTHAGAFKADGRFTLACICDTVARKARAFQKAWQVDSLTTSFDKVCEQKYDLISICTPDHTHVSLVRQALEQQAARVVFVEKPPASSQAEIVALQRLAQKHRIPVIVNFQRRLDPNLQKLRRMLIRRRGDLLTVNAVYFKGLEHIGITMIDLLQFLFGMPRGVLAYNRVFASSVEEYTYEWVAFYDTFNVTVKTIDHPQKTYCYHLFELDLLLSDCRLTLNDNSRNLVTKKLSDYAYSGVKVLDEYHPEQEPTGYDVSMPGSVAYLHDILAGRKKPTINTLDDSLRNRMVADAVVRSFAEQRAVAPGENT